MWSALAPATEQEVRALDLLAGHAREIHRTAEQLVAAKAYSDRLLHEVRHDGLTGLANRDYVLKTLEGRIEHGTTMAIFFIDLCDSDTFETASLINVKKCAAQFVKTNLFAKRFSSEFVRVQFN